METERVMNTKVRMTAVLAGCVLACLCMECGTETVIPDDYDGNDSADTPGDVEIDPADDGDPTTLSRFSFFVTSLAALQELSGSQNGFGGDLRFGETGPGAGLRGADKICAAVAERSMPGTSAKQWRAFLSVTDDGYGNQVDAIDRIGDGPWYDRLGRLVAPSRADLLHDRPRNGNATIRDDLPNEDGVPNHQPDPTQRAVDNHHMLTGSNADGELYSLSATCQDWTTAYGSAANGQPRYGMSWPRGGGGGPGGGGRGGMDGSNWISAGSAPGCAPGVSIQETGPGFGDGSTVGSGGGYGGFYCFALEP
jgi:hypothetical protein